MTRIVLGPRARVQAPPNLVDLAECRALLAAGVDDWGGVSPLTPDHVNPERPWPSLDRLREVTRECGFELRARLTVHPEYVVAGEPWLDPRISGHVAALAGPDGLAKPGVRPSGAAVAGTRRRVRLAWAAPICTRAWTPRAGPRTAAPTSPTSTATGTPCKHAARRGFEARCARSLNRRRRRSPHCVRPRADPGGLSDEHALTLITAEGDLLDQVCRLADDLRSETVGDEVTYVVNRNINFTNVCYVGCRFCAFAQRRTDADAYTLSLDQVADRAAGGLGAGCDRGVHAGRDRPRAARHRLLRPGHRGQTTRPGHARARLQSDGDRQRHRPHRPVGRGLPDQGPRGRPRLPARHRRGDPRR